MIHGIQIPDAVALVVQYDGILTQIVGQILLEDLVDLTVGVLEDHICGRIDCLDVTLVYIQILDAVATVEMIISDLRIISANRDFMLV